MVAASVDPDAEIVAALQQLHFRRTAGWRRILLHLVDLRLRHDGDDVARLHLALLGELDKALGVRGLARRGRVRGLRRQLDLIGAGRQRLAVNLDGLGKRHGSERHLACRDGGRRRRFGLRFRRGVASLCRRATGATRRLGLFRLSPLCERRGRAKRTHQGSNENQSPHGASTTGRSSRRLNYTSVGSKRGTRRLMGSTAYCYFFAMTMSPLKLRTIRAAVPSPKVARIERLPGPRRPRPLMF